MKQYDYLIVGAGLFGAVFAYEAHKRGKTCLVIDKRDHIGGNIHSENKEGIEVHTYGPHIFHTNDKKIWTYIQQFSEFNHFIYSPLAVFENEMYNLPFNMNTFSRMWNIKTPSEASAVLEKQRIRYPHSPKNLEEQALSLAGKDIYEKLIKGYTEKQWGRSCKELPPFIIQRIPLRMTFDNNYFNDTYQGIPTEGYTKIIEKMLAGSDVLLSCDFFKEFRDFKKVAHRLLFTGMIDEYYNYCYGTLEYRSLRFEEEELQEENHQGVAVVNYTSRDVPYTRIIEHKHFTFGNQKKTIITKEYPQQWDKDKEPYYPINDAKNNRLYQRYLKLANAETDVIFGGRLGLYQYYNMDQIIAAAITCAEKEFS